MRRNCGSWGHEEGNLAQWSPPNSIWVIFIVDQVATGPSEIGWVIKRRNSLLFFIWRVLRNLMRWKCWQQGVKISHGSFFRQYDHWRQLKECTPVGTKRPFPWKLTFTTKGHLVAFMQEFKHIIKKGNGIADQLAKRDQYIKSAFSNELIMYGLYCCEYFYSISRACFPFNFSVYSYFVRYNPFLLKK